MADRSTILATLAEQRTELAARYRAFDPEIVTTPCTESEDPDGSPWSPLDHLGHLLRIEKAFLGMAKLTLEGDDTPIKISGTTWEEKIAQVHRDNEAHLEAIRPFVVASLLAELDAARNETVAFIGDLTDEQLEQSIPGAPWGDGSIGGVLMANAGHEQMHLVWVDEALSDK